MKKLIPAINQKGFTLIELMIVVGIIGILVAIAAPNFSRYQSKARQSEAKIALAAVYGAEKSFYSEYAAYMGSMEAVGYAPEGQRRFYGVGWSGAQANTVTGYSGNSSTPSYSTNNNPYTCSGTAPTLGALLSTDSQSFVAAAVGCVRQSAANSDSWNITDTKILTNNVIAL
jgi:prepilin-type N-terminal cleavage/methylation domain-containing protein